MPFVNPVPPVIVATVLTPPNPCGLSNVIVAVPTLVDEYEVETPLIFLPYPKSFTTLSSVSLVILFL